jgi:hypothetical protein
MFSQTTERWRSDSDQAWAFSFSQPKRCRAAGLGEGLTVAGFVDVQILDVDRDFVALATKP